MVKPSKEIVIKKKTLTPFLIAVIPNDEDDKQNIKNCCDELFWHC